jgi:hypothetical protein
MMAAMPSEFQEVNVSSATRFMYRADLCQEIADTTSLRFCLYISGKDCLSMQVMAGVALFRACIESIFFHSFRSSWQEDTRICCVFQGQGGKGSGSITWWCVGLVD